MPKILIVEDEPTILALAQGLVDVLGHTTLTAHNGIEALALIESDPTIEMLFTDINLGPEPDGFALAQSARERCQGLRVLYTSGQSLTDGMKALMVDGSDFLSKPYTPEELMASVTSLLPESD